MTATAAPAFLTFPVQVQDGRDRIETSAAIVREIPLEVFLDGRRMGTIACSGLHPEELAVGFLRAEGLLRDRRELAQVETAAGGRIVRVHRRGETAVPAVAPDGQTIGSSGARGLGIAGFPAPLHEIDLAVTPAQVQALMDALLNGSAIHNLTHGTHCSALATPEGILVLREDIGRHNTLDMLGGYMFLNDIPGRGRILLTTGRVSAEIVQKVWRLGVPILISHSAPTSRALELLAEAGITLIGFVRGGRMNLYTEGKRVIR
jgi:FdhD protein